MPRTVYDPSFFNVESFSCFVRTLCNDGDSLASTDVQNLNRFHLTNRAIFRFVEPSFNLRKRHR
jgi:hypothetical protein